MCRLLCLFILCVIACTTVDAQTAGSVDITIPGLGDVSGTYTQVQVPSVRVNSFLGIPYAEAPVGERRFLPPVAHRPWTERVNATVVRPCLGLSGGSEDCLYLNIYVPGEFNNARRLPVMVLIPGGFLTIASLSDLNGKNLMRDYDAANDVILVTVGHRLNVFGFLTSGDDVIPGNMGHMDQAMAIQWVQDHIASFGGDNSRITLLGQAMGAFSVLRQVLHFSADSRPFQRVAIQSGIFSAKISDKSAFAVNFIRFARELGCDGESTEILQCLQAQTSSDLLTAATEVEIPVPYVDGEFIRENPLDELATADLSGLSVIVGYNSHAANIFLSLYDITDPSFILANGTSTSSRRLMENIADGCTRMAVANLNYRRGSRQGSIEDEARVINMRALRDMVMRRYIPRNATDSDLASAVIHMAKDCFAGAFALEIARAFADGGSSTYLYYFDQYHELMTNPVLGLWNYGTILPYVLGWPVTDPSSSDDERKLSQSVVAAWKSFAHTG